MRGEFIGVWSDTWREIWQPLLDDDAVPADVFCELYRELAPALKVAPSVEDLADTIDNPLQSREAFERTSANDFAGERAIVNFLEAAHPAPDDLLGDELSNRYFNLLAEFIDKFSLRYDLRRPCTLCPTLTGMFASLLRNVNGLALADGNVAKRLKDVQEAVQDLRLGQTEGRISNCVAKQVMLLEAIGATAVGVTGSCCLTDDEQRSHAWLIAKSVNPRRSPFSSISISSRFLENLILVPVEKPVRGR